MRGNGKQQHLALANGADDFPAPHRRHFDAVHVYPHRDPGLLKPLDQLGYPLSILRGVTNENLGTHDLLIHIRRVIDFPEQLSEARL